MTAIDPDSIASRAADAAERYADVAPRPRAAALTAIADALDAARDELIGIAMRETGLTRPRLEGEVRRTSNQLRLFAEVVVGGEHLEARIDRADPDYATGPRPDLRRMLQPLGPSLNFAASNFPFAFSVIGGDSAAALAAGCPVIVKTHSGHPELSAATAAVVRDALAASGMPEGVFQTVASREDGTALLRDERIRVATFTGSGRVGRMLADIAAARPAPIPFYGELGSVNPVYATEAALAADPDLLAGFVGSVSGSAGQLCTKPGFLFVPFEADLAPAAAAAAEVGEHRLLDASIGEAYTVRRRTVLDAAGVETIAEGSVRVDDDGQVWATPTIAAVTAEVLEQHGEALLEESFGPLSIIVRARDIAGLADLHERLFPGNLTSTLHATDAESDTLAPLVAALARTSGRVLFGGWPTGVSVTSAMQHGGPYPATTSDDTSVGTAAIRRFLRGVAYQGAPEALLPPALRDDNPWGVPQRISQAGLSGEWGSLTGRW